MNRTSVSLNQREERQEDWQLRIEHLEEYICELLLTNQALRIALMTARANMPGSGRVQSLSPDSSSGWSR
jgi:hypothetical protein